MMNIKRVTLFFLFVFSVCTARFVIGDDDTEVASEVDNLSGSDFGNDVNMPWFNFESKDVGSPFGLFNMMPFNFQWMDSVFNNMFNVTTEEDVKVTHPKGDPCKFLIQWKKGVLVKDISVDVDKEKRLLILKYSHKETSNDGETSEDTYLEESIPGNCLLTYEVVKDKQAGFAVKDDEESTQVQIWLPKDEKYVEPKEKKGEGEFQFKNFATSTSCVRNIRNGRCEVITTKTVSSPTGHSRSRFVASHPIAEEESEKTEESSEKSVADEPSNDLSERTAEESEEEDIKSLNKRQIKTSGISSNDEDADTHGVDVTSSLLHLKRDEWKDEL